MIIVGPALPCEPKPINPADRFIDLVAMKEYAAWVGFAPGMDFWTRHETAIAWASQRNHEFDAGRGDYYR